MEQVVVERPSPLKMPTASASSTCSKCVKAKRACSGTFPCTRCVKLEQEDGCVADEAASTAPEVEEDAKISCIKCILGKKECSGTIPCARCVKLELEDSCVAAKAASSSKLV